MASNPSNNFNSTGDIPAQSNFGIQAKFNPTTAVVIISLIGGCFVVAFASIALRKFLRGDPEVTVAHSTQSGRSNEKSKVLQKVDVEALPMVRHEDLDEAEAPHECPVCLVDFEPGDTLRLLPTCKHAFHRDCIDAWFDAHSTCPLCRASLVGQSGGEAKLSNPGDEHVVEVGDHGETADTITEVSESNVESRQLTPGDSLLDDSQSAPLTSANDSAHESLSLNSESLKRVTADSDMLLASKTDSSFRKPRASSSMRRPSILSTDLIALRNLLTRESDANGDVPPARWFSRARSLNFAPRDREEGDERVTIDLESGQAVSSIDAAPVSGTRSSPSSGESSEGPVGRALSGRWSLAGVKGAVNSPLTRSTSDVSSHSGHLLM